MKIYMKSVLNPPKLVKHYVRGGKEEGRIEVHKEAFDNDKNKYNYAGLVIIHENELSKVISESLKINFSNFLPSMPSTTL